MTTLGVELTADTARAVLATGDRVAEVPFDPARPELAVAALRAAYGNVGAVALAIGYAHLHVTAPRLPPVAPAQRVAILALEPDRFFPIQGLAAVALAGDTAFAADGAAVERWVAAFGAWTRVAAVHATPVAVARAVDARGTFVIPDAVAGATALVTLAGDGTLAGARRAPIGVPVDAEPLPRVRAGVAPHLAAAVGAAHAAGAAVHDQLLTPALATRMRGERRRRTATAAAACVAALLFTLWSADRARARTLARTEAAVAGLRDSAATALALYGRLTALDGEMEAARGATGGGTADPLAVLAALSARLPRDATVLSLAATGDAWRIEGRAANAAAVVPALDGAPHFADVHLAGPTSRFTEGRRTYESFSVAFRVTP